MEALITLVIIFLILLTAAVAYLFVQLRTFQRIDYSRMMQDEVQSSQLSSRLQMLDQLLNDLNEIELLRQQEHFEALVKGKQELDEHAAQLEQMLMGRDSLTGPETSSVAAAGGAEEPEPASAGLVQFLVTPRQQEIAKLLEGGKDHAEIRQQLSVSEHEIELVASIVSNESSG